ncbi:BTB/POZ and MATH domain-containing protein 3 isoform X2 [Arachis duranensis]|uniref:BTB/POZ and MATH domain-containing protein 3 isoform X2 n=1 Tax=Arachis duranensis TaxID=130453 RepID=A0A6P5NBD7_ARADU|nr:BTB/POZ and MATH domain-containing protein 3 isoform X2 [Arachis duranensis]XP_025690265.1 BTB/POZ and MATH domain-containing protein 3 isoform X2 [Arachis hypogaea]
MESSWSWSRSITETVNGSHQFTIKGYSLAKGMGPGRHIMSGTFNVGGYDWAIYFYPDGKNPDDNSTYVSVFIALASEGTDVRALFKLTLLDQTQNGNHKVHSHFDRPLERGPYTIKYRGSMWGYKRFFKRALLETSEYLKDDCLIMQCTVGVVKTRLEGFKPGLIVPDSDMGRDFKDLLESEIGFDIVFKVKSESFKAHKLILAARSPVFREQFSGGVGDPSIDEIVVDDIEPFVFKNLLAAADLYNLDRLKLLCESKLSEKINTDTVATTLALAEKHHCPQLKAICLKFIANPVNIGVVMLSEAFEHLKEGYPKMLSELLKTFASVDDNSSQPSSRKRSGSRIHRQDLVDGAAAESVNPNGRSLRRRTW